MPILQWLGRDEALKIAYKTPYKLLNEIPENGYGDKDTGNMLIHGDNLEALKALLPFYAGQVKCIYIDPPYNLRKIFENYDDNLEHCKWLSIMYSRLELLKNFLREDGFFCCEIDDSEGQYLKVLLDEIFGRNNYLSTLYVQVRYADKTLTQDMDFHKEIEQIHIYRKSQNAKPNLNLSKASFDKFNFYIQEKTSGRETSLGGKKVCIFTNDEYEIYKAEGSEDGRKEIWASGSILDGNSSGRFFRDYLTDRTNIDGYGVLYKVYGIGDDKFDYRYFTGPKRKNARRGKYYQGVPLDQLNNTNIEQKNPIENFIDLAGAFGNCRLEGGVEFRGGKKPEILIKKLLNYFSNSGDLILDAFLGSGTTAAVAQKMGRRWIGIEKGIQCISHCIPRLKKVTEGTDTGGITTDVNWQGGGGFRFYELGDEVFDGNGKINPDITFEQLAAHIWFAETKTPYNAPARKTTFLGVHKGTAYALLYNGILHDKSVSGGNVLTNKTLQIVLSDIKAPYDKLVVFGEACRLGNDTLNARNIEFRQTPYDIKAR